jgi:hypothetical protein
VYVDHQQVSGLPSCEDTAWLREVPVERVATWYQDYNQHTGYDTRDADPRTAFVQNYRGDGDDYLVWKLLRPSHVRLICIRNGWARDNATFYGVGRLKRVVVQGRRDQTPLEEPGCSESPTLPDKRNEFGGYYRIEFSCKAEDVRLTIKSFYPPGGHREVTPTFTADSVAISDVRIYE